MSGRDPIDPLADVAYASAARVAGGVEIRELVALVDEGRTAMLIDPATGAVALRALSVVELQEGHIGCQVVVAFERGDPSKPIVLGVLLGTARWAGGERPSAVELTADDERVVLTAKSHLVLRCGRASITLTRSGKVLIDGAYVLTRSSGVNRLRGAAVQIN